MKSRHEELLLRTLLAQLDQPRRPRFKTRPRDLVVSLFLWILAFCTFIAFFRYSGTPHWIDALAGVACLGIGYLLAYQFYKLSYARQWPIIAPYLDRAQIEARLHELAPNNSFKP